MQSPNLISSLQDLTWGLPPVSPSLFQGDLNAITTSGLRQSTTLQPFESFPTLSANPPQPSMAFSNEDQRYPQSEGLEIDEEVDAQLDDQYSAGHRKIFKPVSSRSKYGNLDWDGYKEELRRLYLEENQNLDNTMRIMKERHSLPESYVHALMQYDSAC